jgi:hypothetical protein
VLAVAEVTSVRDALEAVAVEAVAVEVVAVEGVAVEDIVCVADVEVWATRS